MKKLASAVLIGAVLIGIETNLLSLKNKDLEQITIESSEDSKWVDSSLKLIKSRYNSNIDPILIETTKLEDTAGRAFPQLGKEQKNEFIALFGKATYEKLKGKDIFALREIDYFQEAIGKKKLWNSKYISNPNLKNMYKRAIVHEIGHLFYDRIKNKKLERKLLEIDIETKAYKEGKNHPAHPSHYTYFLVGFPYLLDDNSKLGIKLKKNSANEQFADIFALQLLGYISEDVKDKALAKKIKLINSYLKKYER